MRSSSLSSLLFLLSALAISFSKEHEPDNPSIAIPGNVGTQGKTDNNTTGGEGATVVSGKPPVNTANDAVDLSCSCEVLRCLDKISIKVLMGEKDAISLADMNSFKRQPRLLENNDTYVYSLDFHCKKNLLFYTANDTIYRATIVSKGAISEPSAVVTRLVEGPVRLAVDWVHDKIYWMADKYQTVEVADLDGKNRETITDTTTPFLYPNNIVVDPHQNVLFFVANYTVFKYNMLTKVIAPLDLDHTTPGDEEGGVRAIALDRANQHVYFTGKAVNITGKPPLYLARIGYGSNNEQTEMFQRTDWSRWNDIYSMDVFKNTLYFAHYQSHNNSGYPDTLWTVNLKSTEFKPVIRFVPKYSRSGIWGIKVYHPCVQKYSDDQNCTKPSTP